MEKKRHVPTLAHHAAVHRESLYFRLLLGTNRGSGSVKTSRGRVRPSRGSSDSVRESAASARGGGGGCGGDSRSDRRGGRDVAAMMSGGGCPESTEDDEGEGEGERSGEACASQPFASSSRETPRRGTDCA